MKTGYDQFFKKAKQARQNSEKTTTAVSPEAKLMKRLKTKKVPSGPKASFPWGAFVFVVLGAGTAGWGLVHPETFEELSSKIEINMFGNAIAAEDAAKKSQDKVETKEKTAAAKAEAEGKDGAKKESWTDEEFNHFSKLNERKKELDEREAELGKLEEELQKQKVEIETKIKQLDEIRRSIAGRLDEKVKVDEEKVTKLVEMYKNMKPIQAAKVVESLDEDLAVEILDRMKQKNAAEIMGFIAAEKAKSLSEKLTGYQRR
jgi:flagellar motility protein MotE (MotC chaperone)